MNVPKQEYHTKGCIYSKVDNQKRMMLLKMVREEGTSLKNAASLLKINYSTAKTILRVFRLENRILKKSSYKKQSLVRLNSDSRETNHTMKSDSETTNDSLDADKIIKLVQYANLTLQKCINEVISNELIIAKLRVFININSRTFN
jgi:hypothetical protein